MSAVQTSDHDAHESLSTSIPMVPTPTKGLARIVERTVDLCNQDKRNNKNGHVGCLLLRDAVISHDVVTYDASKNPAMPRQYPPLGASRHHMKPIRFTASTNLVSEEEVEVGYFQSPVIGAQWENAWHSIADFLVMLFHTVSPLMDNGVLPVWFTRPARAQLNKGCSTEGDCSRQALFDPFSKIFQGRFVFVEPKMKSILVKYLVVGMNTRCSPIPTENVDVPECQQNLRQMRDTLMLHYGIPNRNVSAAERQCPTIHLMSRQGDKYRHITPFDEFQKEMFVQYGRRFPGCNGDQRISVIKINSRMSFRDQLLSVFNHSVLVAGRGGGTALSIFLPDGGLYVSLSGFDRWSPYRGLVPWWISMQHVEVSLVHHEDWRRPPMQFGSGHSRYIDPNRAAYLVKPVETTANVMEAIRRWQG